MTGAWDRSHAPARPWRAGAWTLEQRDDELADVAFDGVVVLRAVRVAIRDRDWNTAGIALHQVDASDTTLSLHLRSAGLGSSFSGVLTVIADEGGLRFECDLRSAEAFDTNRTGLVVLHPPTLAGTALAVTHPGGAEQTARFPVAISPHQPVRDIAALAWRQEGLDVRVGFEGDVFEMEDQRNWTDASYKTYSRPLDLPFPYRVEAGERVRQAVQIRVAGTPTGTRPDPRSPTRIDLSDEPVVFPMIGLGASTAPEPAPPGPIRANHVLVELDLASRAWRAALERAAASGRPLDVRLIVDDHRPDALEKAVALLAGRSLARVGVFAATGPAAHVSDAPLVAALRSALREAGLDVPVVGGARSHFTELNREHHRLPDDLDGIVFSITPLFHALSTEQLVESIAMQRLVAEQAVDLAGGAPVHVGPVTLRPHLNNVATTPPPRSTHADLSEGYGPQLIDADDPRQASPELAAWTLASATALAVPGVRTITYFEEWGPRGVRSRAGEAYPAAQAIDLLCQISGHHVRTGSSADGLIWVAAQNDGAVLVGNLDARLRSVLVPATTGTCSADLQPYSVTRLR